MPHVQPFPKKRSVVVLDGCIIHMTDGILKSVLSRGALVLFLEPYDPVHMPVEIGFRSMKGWWRCHRAAVAHLPMIMQIELAADSVLASAARAAFRECDYPVP
jgi:hypothetical protein